MPPEPLSLEDYAAFTDLAREFNEWVPAERVRTASHAPSDAKGTRPGDEFNRKATWTELLDAHGWKVERTSGDVTYWTRPGKDRGVSATTGKCSSESGGDLLYVFSSNAAPFEPEHAYSKFSAYAILDHKGDWGGAAKELARRGFGEQQVEVKLKSVQTLTPTEQMPADDDIQPDFNFATADDLRRLGIELSWVWDGWLQQGVVNLLAAEGGTGKTRFMMDLVRRVATGGTWPDGTPCPPFTGQYIAMWVAADGNHAELLKLSEEFGISDRIAYSGTKTDPTGYTTLDTMGDFLLLHRKVKAASPLFLVIDTAGGATSRNLAKQEEARGFFAPAAAIALRRKVCVVGITHLNANKTVLGRRAEERVRVVMRMCAKTPNDKNCPRRIEVLKSNSLIPQPLGCLLGATGNNYDVDAPPSPEQERGDVGAASAAADPDTAPTKVKECMDWLSDVLASQPRKVHELREAAEAHGFSSKTLYKARNMMGLIEQTDSNSKKWWGLMGAAASGN